MTNGLYEKLASEKVTDTTLNIGPEYFLIVDLLNCCNYLDVFNYGLLYSENAFKHWYILSVKVKRCNLIDDNL